MSGERVRKVLKDLKLPPYIRQMKTTGGRTIFYVKRDSTGWENAGMFLGMKYGEFIAIIGNICDDGDGIFLETTHNRLYESAKKLEEGSESNYGKSLSVEQIENPIPACKKGNVITVKGKAVTSF